MNCIRKMEIAQAIVYLVQEVVNCWSMEILPLRMFQRQILFQCQVFALAMLDFKASLVTNDVTRSWCAVQNLLNAAANISKALWGKAGKLAEERKPLRESIGLQDDSPLRNVTMRNNFEHMDERLDKWWKESTRHNVIDFGFGDMHSPSIVQGIDNIDIFRNFVPRTGELIFWNQRFDLDAIAKEIARIHPEVAQEANKPHWETRPSTPREPSSGTPPDAGKV